MAKSRTEVMTVTSALAGLAIAAATLIAALDKHPYSSPWLRPTIGVAVASTAVFVVAALAPLGSWVRRSVGSRPGFRSRRDLTAALSEPAGRHLGEGPGALLPPLERQPEQSPLKMVLVDEDWSLVEDTLWTFALAVQVDNRSDKTILIVDFTFTNWEDGDRNSPLWQRFRDIWPAVNRETESLFKAHLNDGYSGIFEPDLLFSPKRPETLWYIGAALPPEGGGRPRFTFTLKDSHGNSYDMDIERRAAQRFRA